jgi:hypothetical protein
VDALNGWMVEWVGLEKICGGWWVGDWEVALRGDVRLRLVAGWPAASEQRGRGCRSTSGVGERRSAAAHQKRDRGCDATSTGG